jgi:hypothetical protein
MATIVNRYYCFMCCEYVTDVDTHLMEHPGHVVCEVFSNSSKPAPAIQFPIYPEGHKSLKFKLTGTRANPGYINFCLECLFKKEIMVKGDIVRQEYYKDFNPATYEYSNQLLYVTYEYTDNEDKLPISRTMRIHYLLEDESVGYIKVKQKYYNSVSSIAVRKMRLTNRLNQVKAYLASTLKTILPNGLKEFEDLLLQIEKITLHDVALMIGDAHPAYNWFINNSSNILTLYQDGNTDGLIIYASYVDLEYFEEEHRVAVLEIL